MQAPSERPMPINATAIRAVRPWLWDVLVFMILKPSSRLNR
jgi:hypothetical protein